MCREHLSYNCRGRDLNLPSLSRELQLLTPPPLPCAHAASPLAPGPAPPRFSKAAVLAASGQAASSKPMYTVQEDEDGSQGQIAAIPGSPGFHALLVSAPVIDPSLLPPSPQPRPPSVKRPAEFPAPSAAPVQPVAPKPVPVPVQPPVVVQVRCWPMLLHAR